MNRNHTGRVRHRYRLPPCPAYDVEGTESWLQSMAAEGYRLCKGGFFAGLARFEQGEPQAMRYRLQAALTSPSLWAEDGSDPGEEALAFSADCGWEYLGRRGQFYLFASRDPAARELDTDPQVQALALDMVRRRERASLLVSLFWMVLWPCFFLWGSFLRGIIELGTGLFLLGVVLALWSLGSSLAQAVHLRGLRRRLAGGQPPDHHKNWRRHARWHQASLLCFLALALCWGGLFLHRWRGWDAQTLPLPSYTGSLPVPTLRQLQPDGVFSWDDLGSGNTLRVGSDWLAPTTLSLLETGTVRLEDGRTVGGILDVDYYEARWPWVARELARELQRQDQRTYRRHFARLPAPALPVEQVVAYQALSPTLILVEGNRVARVTFIQTGSCELPLEAWGARFAAALRE